MTAQEKAKEIFDKFYSIIPLHPDEPECSKECALIVVEEILINKSTLFEFVSNDLPDEQIMCSLKYWQQVKEEILKL